MFALHLVFTARINTSLGEFATMFNSHGLSTEHNWTTNQIWLNGILDENNPINSNEDLEESVDQFYGEDPDGPHPPPDGEESVVEPIQIAHGQEITNYVFQMINVYRPSIQAGIVIYSAVLTIVVQKLEECLTH